MFNWLKFKLLELGVRIFKPKMLGVFKMWKGLQGKKSYIVAGVGVIVNGLFAMGYIDKEVAITIDAILGSLFGITISAKLNRAKQ